MSVALTVDGERWRDHLRAVMTAEPALVPVIKGNGYGFGNGRLARKCAWLADQGLGADTVAVGTYPEIADVESRCAAEVIVLSPWRGFLPGAAESLADERVIHTVGRREDLAAIGAAAAEAGARPRILLERLTSMKRHGFTARGLREAAATLGGSPVRLAGVSLHLPLTGPANLAEADELMNDVVSAGLLKDTGLTVHVSHLLADDLATLRQRYPEVVFRPRVGTDLWLGDRGALRVTATVLDRHPVERGDTFGYRGRTTPRSGTILVVSGGTAHGIGLEAPTGEGGLRARAGSLARGGLDAVGAVRSPYTVAGKQRFFAEPPHMQASMVFLPGGVEAPAIGDQVELRVRFTATSFDEVVID